MHTIPWLSLYLQLPSLPTLQIDMSIIEPESGVVFDLTTSCIIYSLPSSFLFDRLDQAGHSTNGSSSTSSSDTDSDDDRNGRSSSHRHGDRLKPHLYRPYGSSNHVGSKSPPSRSSSVAGSTQHSASSSIGSTQIMDPSQASLSPANGKRAIKKRRKDPLAPKRPSNAFFIFSQQHRQQAREEKKEGNQSELTKFLGLQWKSMPSTEKKVLPPTFFSPITSSVEDCPFVSRFRLLSYGQALQWMDLNMDNRSEASSQRGTFPLSYSSRLTFFLLLSRFTLNWPFATGNGTWMKCRHTKQKGFQNL